MSNILLVCQVASLTSAAQALVREPYGCFEQTSAAVYPNVMAQQYFKTHPGASPKLMEKSYMLLATGLERLRGYEVEGSGGYEWFGKAPAHEALTAYGLQLFTDMAQVGSPCRVVLSSYSKSVLNRCCANWFRSCRSGI